MPKENNCRCVVCEVERSLLNSLSTQTAQTHFQALAHNYPALDHFDSPADVIAQLHEHEQVEIVNHKAWNGILHALVESIADRTAEEIGQQLLLLAYMPAIHKVYREACRKLPGLCPEDIAQQAALCFLETARSPEIQSLNGNLPGALAMRFRRRLFRWAISELRQSFPLEEIAGHIPETHARNLEEGIFLEQLLSKAQRMGILSTSECKLVRKFHCEGFLPEELRESGDCPSAIALYYRIQRAVHRLRRIGATDSPRAGSIPQSQDEDFIHEKVSSKSRKSLSEALDFSEEMGIRNSEKGNSPELTRSGTQRKSEVPPVAA
jgi:hypothetical protein